MTDRKTVIGDSTESNADTCPVCGKTIDDPDCCSWRECEHCGWDSDDWNDGEAR